MKTCEKCERIDVSEHAFEWNKGLCDPCYTWKRHHEDIDLEKKSDLQTRMSRWLELCPQTYRDNETGMIDENAFKKVTSYKLSPRGILCMGDSRMGKTTSCWRLLETLYVLHGINFKAITEVEFAQECEGYSKEKKHFLNELINCKILFLDDIGHASSTRSHLQDLSYVIEKRTQWKKPIICTTQFSANELMERARGGEKTIVAILNRLKTHCEIVNF